LTEAGYLLDVNVLIALVLGGHPYTAAVTQWFISTGGINWGTCVLTEAGFLRIMSNPKAGRKSIEESAEALALFAQHPGHRFWPIADSCNTLIAPFSGRLFGHLQVTDALLLGLAVQQNGILVTMNRAIRHLAGPQYRQNLLVLEPS
jgi:predicted nucleic acid-binding protein